MADVPIALPCTASHRIAPPSDGNIIEAMRPLHNLPVWVVLRLCTDDDRIGNFWSAIDRQVDAGLLDPFRVLCFLGIACGTVFCHAVIAVVVSPLCVRVCVRMNAAGAAHGRHR